MVINMMENGKTKTSMVKGNTHIEMEVHTMVSGLKTCKMVMELKHGQMGPDMQVISKTGIRKVKENLFCQIKVSTKVTL